MAVLNNSQPYERFVITSSEEPEVFVLFYSGWSALSNFRPAPFNIGGKKYRSVQQYIEAQKAVYLKRPDLLNVIMQTYSPRKCYDIMNSITAELPSGWNKDLLKHMKVALRAKFNHHPELRDTLVQTGTAYLVFASPHDMFLGSGLPLNHADCTNVDKFPGKNWLGRTLMKLRDEFDKAQEVATDKETSHPVEKEGMSVKNDN